MHATPSLSLALALSLSRSLSLSLSLSLSRSLALPPSPLSLALSLPPSLSSCRATTVSRADHAAQPRNFDSKVQQQSFAAELIDVWSINKILEVLQDFGAPPRSCRTPTLQLDGSTTILIYRMGKKCIQIRPPLTVAWGILAGGRSPSPLDGARWSLPPFEPSRRGDHFGSNGARWREPLRGEHREPLRGEAASPSPASPLFIKGGVSGRAASGLWWTREREREARERQEAPLALGAPLEAPAPSAEGLPYRGTSPIRNRQSGTPDLPQPSSTGGLGPYGGPRGVGVSYERGTPAPVQPSSTGGRRHDVAGSERLPHPSLPGERQRERERWRETEGERQRERETAGERQREISQRWSGPEYAEEGGRRHDVVGSELPLFLAGAVWGPKSN